MIIGTESLSKLSMILVIGLFLLLLNSAYLAAYADANMFYAANVLLHIGLGIVLTIAFSLYVFRHIRTLSLTGILSAGALFLSAALGLFLTYFGALTPYRWVLYIHIGSAVLGLILLALYLHNLAFQPKASQATKVVWKSYVAILSLALIFPIAMIVYKNYHHPSPADRIENPDMPPMSMFVEGDGQDSHFFPSSATTTTGELIPADFFMNPEACARCHEDIYNQWYSSAHHFSSFNNQWYKKSVEYMQSVIGIRPSLWCAGCHDHAVFFNGMMQQSPIEEIVHTPEAQRGLTCMSCHAIAEVNSSMGQGDFKIEYPPLHDLASSDNKIVQFLHDLIVRADPEPHKKTFLKPFMRKNTAEFCSACHKVHLDVPVNKYRWIRGFNEYDNWQASGVSGQGARSFYYPDNPMKCTDCHMPLVRSNDDGNIDGYVHSHRFPGANTALPVVNQDKEQLRTIIEFLKDDQVTVDIFAMSEPYEQESVEGETLTGKVPAQISPQIASTFAVGEESEAFLGRGVILAKPLKVFVPIDKVGATVRRGDSVRIDVVVRTRKVGHFFPGGTVDAFDVWLELQAIDDRGQIIFWSGMVEENGKGPVEKGAHFYRSLQVDEHGNPINKRNAWATRSVVYVRLIPPGAADTVHFRMEIPENCGDEIRLVAKLNYRKFAWWNTQWAFAGVRDPEHKDYSIGPGHDDGRWVFRGDTSKVSGKLKHIPDLPIVVMSEDESILKVIDKKAPLPRMESVYEKEDLERWNDYGIGLLLQGDLKGAEAAFLRVTEIDPTYPDGWVNIARCRIQEGNPTGAQEVLKKALELDPGLAKTNYFYALTLKAQGKYDDALKYLRKASDKYPRDRVVLNKIGRILFLKRQFTEAIEEFKKTLKVDPEDLQAHYNLMLSYKGAGNQEMAEIHYKLYLRFKVDESSQFITGAYRRLNPEDNNERQRIHEHVSISNINYEGKPGS